MVAYRPPKKDVNEFSLIGEAVFGVGDPESKIEPLFRSSATNVADKILIRGPHPSNNNVLHFDVNFLRNGRAIKNAEVNKPIKGHIPLEGYE